jgi:hypothetical protein
MLAKKLVRGEESLGQNIAVLGSGLVGALAFTWSDSFWYSAVEGEVYAMSSFFTAVAFWAALKWESAADHDLKANRWLLLVAYLTGLSVGVHILVFLTIPAVVMIYFYKNYPKVTWKTWVVANAVSVFVLALVFAVIIPVILRLFGFFEITAVNSIGLPKNSGSVLMVLALVAGVYFGIRWAVKNNRPLVEQGILAVVMLLVGYSSFVVLAIRSNANTPIDENNPEDAMSLLAYYNREQYGDWPVLYGQSFNSKLDSQKPYADGSPTYLYSEETGKYEVVSDGKASKPNYAKDDVGFFPRMWSDQADHVENYQRIFGANPDQKITFSEHFKYFLDYQVGQMWFRRTPKRRPKPLRADQRQLDDGHRLHRRGASGSAVQPARLDEAPGGTQPLLRAAPDFGLARTLVPDQARPAQRLGGDLDVPVYGPCHCGVHQPQAV